MKNLIKFSMLVVLIASACNVNAQTHCPSSYPVAVCSSGILIGDYKIRNYKDGNSDVNPSPDTISKEAAKSIFVLNHIYADKENKIYRGKIKDYSMTVYNDDGTEQKFKSTTELLTDEMKASLQQIKSGEKIFFEYVNASKDGYDAGPIICLSFTVR